MQWSKITFTENLRRIAQKNSNWLLLKGDRKPFKIEQNPIFKKGFSFFDEFLNEETLLSDRQIKYSICP